MSSFKAHKYVIGVIYNHDTWYYTGVPEGVFSGLESRYSSCLIDAKIYDDRESAINDLSLILPSLARKILEVQCCPKCGKVFTDYPALSREDNKTEICPECGVKEALLIFSER